MCSVPMATAYHVLYGGPNITVRSQTTPTSDCSNKIRETLLLPNLIYGSNIACAWDNLVDNLYLNAKFVPTHYIENLYY
jgi:hypothetical protein